jgi:hypothetical protein
LSGRHRPSPSGTLDAPPSQLDRFGVAAPALQCGRTLIHLCLAFSARSATVIAVLNTCSSSEEVEERKTKLEHKNPIIQRMEEEKKIKDAISYHIANTKWDGRTHWGPWFLEEKNNALAFMYADGGVLKRHYYDIPLERVVAVYGHGSDTIEDWSFQLNRHSWTTNDEVLQLVEALCSLYNGGKCGEQATA